jgi:hypothetical protein
MKGGEREGGKMGLPRDSVGCTRELSMPRLLALNRPAQYLLLSRKFKKWWIFT